MKELVFEAPLGLDVYHIAKRITTSTSPILYIARDRERLNKAYLYFKFFNPHITAYELPSWDSLPYDRVSPQNAILAKRTFCLYQLAKRLEHGDKTPFIIFANASTLLQKLPPPEFWQGRAFTLAPKQIIDISSLSRFLSQEGYMRVTTVREPSEYAIRGNIIDIFPPLNEHPIRLDLFGDEIDTMRVFNAQDQKTLPPTENDAQPITLMTVSEYGLDEASVQNFRQSWRANFGGNTEKDEIFQAVSEQRRIAGLEQWLPLFHDHMVGLNDYLSMPADIYFDDGAKSALHDHQATIIDHYHARCDMDEATKKQNEKQKTASENNPLYKPIPPHLLYHLHPDIQDDKAINIPILNLAKHITVFSPFAKPDEVNDKDMNALGGKLTNSRTLFSPLKHAKDASQIGKAERIKALVHYQKKAEKPVIIMAQTPGARERIRLLLKDNCDVNPINITKFQDGLKPGLYITLLPIDQGFTAHDFIIFCESDIVGERISRNLQTHKRARNFISELATINKGDIVVHSDHGIGRFDGLEVIEVQKAPHDFLRLIYAGGDRLYLPVENLDLLSRYGASEQEVELDRLGSASWQARKAKSKERIRDIADRLIKLAAQRELVSGEVYTPPEGLWERFCQGFGFVETDDQLRAIDDVLNDLASGKAMDRLICGDVGFGKTEIALRTAFIIAMMGKQVALLAPTTLLVRQHFQLFKQRFEDFGIRIEMLSRFVSAHKQRLIKQEIKDGKVDIVIGTHALIAKSTEFDNLGLVIIDEEQHFGVAQKERLKERAKNVHFLAMTATPIPRTLQMSLSGVRELSIIATPPVDRMAVKSFVIPYDRLILQEAIRREIYRGGQIFYVTPRIADLDLLERRIRQDLAPQARMAVAHGQLPTAELETIMEEFIDGKFDILLSTNIVESGLDIPKANTIIIHRADKFGLSQLYQLRGRVGRSSVRAYCYLTTEAKQRLTNTAEKRLHVMNGLEGLGAGFTLASHDMDIRGAGNLLGEQQSGHIREVGVELYQAMLEQAIEEQKADQDVKTSEASLSPILTLGVPVMIPEDYIEDLHLRMSLYRRLANLEEEEELSDFAGELVDRFGPLHQDVEILLIVMRIKRFAKQAGIAKLDAGPKGAVIGFHKNRYQRPDRLVDYIHKLAPHAKLRTDHKLVIARNWQNQDKRLKGLATITENLAKMAMS